MNEQLMGLCDVATRLEAAASRAKQVFGHVPALSSDPLSALWQLLSLCCLPQLERVAALSSSASFFSLLDLLRFRLESSKLYCRYCATVAPVFLILILSFFSGLAILTFVILRIFVQFHLPVQFPRL